jgi:uncharacterized protein YceH (UPF0502 family)
LPGSVGPWPVLDVQERRVLGVLVEKAKTTPDAYPMSLNALVTGCNQKSNREPVLDLEEDDVEEALLRCKSRGLVCKVIGGRVERWRQLLYESWHVEKVEIAILAELLLRGPQTEGELRGRASRMEPIDDLEILRSHIKPLVDRNLIVYLTPEERRGAMLTHGFHEPNELARLRARVASIGVTTSAPAASPVAPSPPRSEERPAGGESAVASLRQEVMGMRQQLEAAREKIAALEQVVRELREGLSAARRDLDSLKTSLGG